jgi:lipopolysaccharide export LptBFGC system permease protein LptF
LIWTLHKYLGRDLARVALLAATAFTLVMTTFAIIEPMRQMGLSPPQALRLFWYLLPVMISLTLPIAALLSATMVYGRFSMENELAACRSSGISYYSLLKPAMVLAVLVSLVSLLMSNWVAPKLAQQGEAAGRANLRGLVYQKLRTQMYVRHGEWLIHADRVDTANNVLYGVVAASTSAPGQTRYVTSSTAFVDFKDAPGGATDVTIRLVNVSQGEQGDMDVRKAEEFAVGPYPVPQLFKESTMFYDWHTLSAIRQDPRNSPVVRGELEAIQRQLHANSLYLEAAEAVNAGGAYDLSDKDGRRFRFRAPRAVQEKNSLVLSGPEGAGAADQDVVVEIFTMGNVPEQVAKCRQARIATRDLASVKKTAISATLTDVSIRRTDEPKALPIHRADWSVGSLEMPESIERRLENVDLEALWRQPESFPAVKRELAELKRIVGSLNLKVLAEMHGRVAYGTGCLLLVAAGAALGTIFRGGNILSAFALSCIPAMVLIVLLVMGKQMVGNQDVPTGLGLAAIWSGVAVLAAMVAYLYGVALRR